MTISLATGHNPTTRLNTVWLLSQSRFDLFRHMSVASPWCGAVNQPKMRRVRSKANLGLEVSQMSGIVPRSVGRRARQAGKDDRQRNCARIHVPARAFAQRLGLAGRSDHAAVAAAPASAPVAAALSAVSRSFRVRPPRWRGSARPAWSCRLGALRAPRAWTAARPSRRAWAKPAASSTVPRKRFRHAGEEAAEDGAGGAAGLCQDGRPRILKGSPTVLAGLVDRASAQPGIRVPCRRHGRHRRWPDPPG